tara:strand:+ start:3759 stop:4076 length:318 start_codon:yes stop_codon:yes gene_type:complete
MARLNTKEKARLIYLEFKDSLGMFTSEEDIINVCTKHISLIKEEMINILDDDAIKEYDEMISILSKRKDVIEYYIDKCIDAQKKTREEHIRKCEQEKYIDRMKAL